MRLTKCLGAILRIEVKEEQMKVDCLHESLFLKAIDHEPQSTIKITINLAISKSINHKPRQLKNLQRTDHKGPVVRRPIRANTGLNFILGFFTPLFESLFGIIFSILYGASNHQIVDKKNYTEFSMKPFRSEIRFHTNSGLS